MECLASHPWQYSKTFQNKARKEADLIHTVHLAPPLFLCKIIGKWRCGAVKCFNIPNFIIIFHHLGFFLFVVIELEYC